MRSKTHRWGLELTDGLELNEVRSSLMRFGAPLMSSLMSLEAFMISERLFYKMGLP